MKNALKATKSTINGFYDTIRVEVDDMNVLMKEMSRACNALLGSSKPSKSSIANTGSKPSTTTSTRRDMVMSTKSTRRRGGNHHGEKAEETKSTKPLDGGTRNTDRLGIRNGKKTEKSNDGKPVRSISLNPTVTYDSKPKPKVHEYFQTF